MPHRRAMAERRRGRAQRRLRDRAQQRLAQEIEQLAQLEDGGSPERPIPVDSVAVIELRATANPCPLCGGPLKLEAHTAEAIDGVRLRVAAVACTLCGSQRAVYFRLDEPLVH
ncbi:MAG: hypothetical protein SF182_10235 [Deltaproteobacteria bacterium]|nr:hypothetical protein [Deltaproteobacteria bacterium]